MTNSNKHNCKWLRQQQIRTRESKIVCALLPEELFAPCVKEVQDEYYRKEKDCKDYKVKK